MFLNAYIVFANIGFICLQDELNKDQLASE